MGEVKQSIEVTNGGKKRRVGKKKGKMAKKRQRMMPQGAENRMKVDKRMRKLFQKRARDYNSDEEGEDEQLQQSAPSTAAAKFKRSDDEFEGGFSDDGEEENQGIEEDEVSEDEDGGIQPGISKFTEGIKAFKLAFKKVVKKSGGDAHVLGLVLSAHKKLLAEKIAEEEEEKKVKGEAKKEKHLIGEKGHVEPANYLDAHEKFLLSVATKGVVKLFNAVNKAQNAQKGLNPSRAKDEKVIKKRRKEAFFSELGKTSSQSAGMVVKVGTSNGFVDGETPAWAPLRDNYMLTNPKLKDWDKMQGNSGGPLVNVDGEVVGVNIMKVLGADGLNFAVPIDSVSKIIEHLKTNGRVVRPWLGWKMLDLNDMIVAHLKERNASFPDVSRGVLIPMVTPGSPADRAGFRRGDVVVEFGGKPIGSIKEVIDIMGDKIGKPFKAVVKRANNVTVNLTVIPEEANPDM